MLLKPTPAPVLSTRRIFPETRRTRNLLFFLSFLLLCHHLPFVLSELYLFLALSNLIHLASPPVTEDPLH
jgi:hypothetical protein